MDTLLQPVAIYSLLGTVMLSYLWSTGFVLPNFLHYFC